MGGGGEGQQLQCKSELAQCLEKQQSPCEGEEDLTFEKNAGKTIKLRKNLPYVPSILYFFFTLNPTK